MTSGLDTIFQLWAMCPSLKLAPEVSLLFISAMEEPSEPEPVLDNCLLKKGKTITSN